MTTVRARRLPSLTPERVREEVRDLLSAHPAPDGEVLVVPDLHYPFHPSTGLVTDPTVLAAVVDALRAGGADVAVGLAGAGPVDRTARWVGYEAALDEAADLVDLDAVDREPVSADPDEGPVRLSVPAPLAERAVVAVSAARTDGEGDLAAATATLARACGRSETAPARAAAAAVADPTLTLVDGSYTYLGEARRSEFLLAAGPGRHAAVDWVLAAATEGLDPPPETERPGDDPPEPRVTLRGLTLEDLRAATAAGDANDSEGSEPGSLAQRGYRAYATVTGDLLPPPILGGDRD